MSLESILKSNITLTTIIKDIKLDSNSSSSHSGNKPIKTNKEDNTMLTLERVKKATQTIPVGTKLLCYEGNQYFTEGEEYTIENVNEHGYYVGIGLGLSILFGSEKALKTIFMIEN